MQKTKLHISAALGGVILSAISTASIAEHGNPFQAKALPQGYMVLAENTLPEPPQPPENSANTNTQIENKTAVKKSNKLLSGVKSFKAQDGGCGAGSCAAKLNKAKGQNLAK
jgi:uncharacterized low-complexity protein